jgi:hypothetical protein
MSLPDYDDAFERAADKRPFANGDEGYGWMGANCGSCIHDKPAREDHPENGCPLIMVALVGKTPTEWLDQKVTGPHGYEPYSIEDQYRCMYWRSEDDGPGDGEPQPVPDPPGQLTLMPREPLEGVRMFADTKPREAVTA